MAEDCQALINMAAYNATLMIWLVYSWAKSPAREAPANLLRPQRWEQSLTDIRSPTSRRLADPYV